jgi:hypothetical protein
MTAWGTLATVPQAENTDKDSAKDGCPPAQPVLQSRHGIAAIIKNLFRYTMRQLTHKTPAPAPTSRRRSTTEDGGRAFKIAARKIMRRVISLPPIAYLAALVSDNPLDPANPYWHDPATSEESPAHFQDSDQNHLSLDL